ncbi:hypothetical protein [Vannielia litorea]|uniref:Uncharacterized protein n=1 Tax=Vannielia litorea TaxID=1217970 RepID=A0A1N6FN71_9RHOB|nr:hypothetical protein [Vannielia litorea]SIN96640.1 hypothetical protein SAMN05444002_1805 [Vannielia litorea]
MDPALILFLGFIVGVAVLRASMSRRKKHRINPDPDPDEAPQEPETDTPQRRPSYGAARSRTRNLRE